MVKMKSSKGVHGLLGEMPQCDLNQREIDEYTNLIEFDGFGLRKSPRLVCRTRFQDQHFSLST